LLFRIQHFKGFFSGVNAIIDVSLTYFLAYLLTYVLTEVSIESHQSMHGWKIGSKKTTFLKFLHNLKTSKVQILGF